MTPFASKRAVTRLTPYAAEDPRPAPIGKDEFTSTVREESLHESTNVVLRLSLARYRENDDQICALFL